ncbi:MAG TPA: FtsX-like permease family protein, partial [Pyrinomonadaceae bacterium]|nr:FtsX-like permease family protein [Pyrinomonadaceae bacterium]
QATDTENAPLVAIIDEKLARTYWPNEDPIGKRIRTSGDLKRNPWLTIVGVVPGVKKERLDEDTRFYIYKPFAQSKRRSMYVVIRTADKPEALLAELRAQVAALDPELPLFDVHTMEQAINDSVSTKRLTNLLLAGFAATALLLAAVGIYGVMSLNVNSRIHEFGIRLALGAQPRDVLRLVVRQGMLLALIGAACGLISALWLTHFLASLLFKVQPTDPLIFAVVTFLLTAVAFMACYIPARRATRVDPLVALRAE